jgi:(5-formylfuran-3-yl)methyl phosphate synthase
MKLLVSVRDATEACDAVAGGADWIDLKEPLAGALGAVSAHVAQTVVGMIGKERPISAALGELSTWKETFSGELLSIPEISVVKLGLAQCGRLPVWQSQWHDAFETCSHHGKSLAAVVYADWCEVDAPRPEAVLECACRAGGKYLLIDTFHKQDLSSIEILGRVFLSRLLHQARLRGLTTVLAGRLRVNDLPYLADLPVDVVAIRSAACGGQRTSQLDAAMVRLFRCRLSEANKIKNLNSLLTTSN